MHWDRVGCCISMSGAFDLKWISESTMTEPTPTAPLEEQYFLGFDLSTQSVKAIITNGSLEIVHQVLVRFDHDLPEFGTSGGVNREPNSKVVTAQPMMWIKAIDLAMEKLRLLEQSPPFEKIVGISGAGQQHGSVYWKRGARESLRSLDPDRFLHEQLPFSIPHSPVWMDSSTTDYCDKLERWVGGPGALANITGSKAYERFTGSQISKIFHTKREAYNATERISLVSSFLASIFLGDYAEIDYSDGSGMNLLDLREKCWSDKCLEGIITSSNSSPEEAEKLVAGLKERLGAPVPTESVLGPVSSYFVERYGFSKDCKVVAFTGDNPSSFAEMGLGPTDIAVSLGTSDTLFLSLPSLPSKGFGEGHIFVNPIRSLDNSYMGLLCFKNGSLTRERIRRDYAGGSWSIFNELLESTPRGNFGNIGFYFDLWEIIPKIKNGDHKFNKEGERLGRFTSNEVEVRALIEGQFLSRRLHAENIGCKITPETKILATGGASANHKILQVLSDVFNAPVYVQAAANSAGLGACFRIKHALFGDGQPFEKVVQLKGDEEAFKRVCLPNKDAKKIYDKMLRRYEILEQRILRQF